MRKRPRDLRTIVIVAVLAVVLLGAYLVFLERHEAQMAAYYAGRGSNVKLSDWSTAVAGAMQGKKREHMLAFLRERGFFLR